MPRGNFACRVDANQKEIVSILRQLGASVLMLHKVGFGCPDILVGFNGKNALVEIKDGNNPPSQQKLTALEEQFFLSWSGQVSLIKNAEEALGLIQAMREW